MALIGDILYRLRGDYSDLDKKSKAASKSLKDTEKSSKSLQGSFGELSSVTSDLGGVFKSVVAGVMAGSMALLMKRAVMTAARTQVLGTSLLLVGQNSGYLRDELADSEKQLKALGITTQVARSTLVRMISTEMEVTRATELANAARNLAVISGKNTSQTMETLIHGLITMQAETLRTVGVTINMEEASRKYGETIGKNVAQMTMAERRQGVLNEVIAFAVPLTGAYETAMGDAFKQIASFARYTEEAASALTEFLLPSLNKVVVGVGNLVKWFTKLDPEIRRTILTIGLFTIAVTAVVAIGVGLAALTPIIAGVTAAFATFVVANPILLALTVLIAALASAWATNLGGIQEKTKVVLTAVAGFFNGLFETVKSVVKGFIAYFRLLHSVISKPWELGKALSRFEKDISVLVGETRGAWLDMLGATKEALKDMEKASEESNIALRKGTLKLTEEQKKARDDLRAHTGKVTKAQIDEIAKLQGEELIGFINKEKRKYDAQQAVTKERLMIASRYQKALEDIHKKELKSKADLEKAKIKIEMEMGRISEEESIRRSHAIVERSFRAEIEAMEKSLPKRLELMKKLSKPEEDIRAERLKGEAEIEALRREMVTEALKYDLELLKLKGEKYSEENVKRIAQLEHRHVQEATAEKKALLAHEVTRGEIVDSESRRQRELLELRLSVVREEMAVLEEQGRIEGERYQDLALREQEILRERTEAHAEHAYEVALLEEKRIEHAREVESTLLSLKKEALEAGYRATKEYTDLELEEYDLLNTSILERIGTRFEARKIYNELELEEFDNQTKDIIMRMGERDALSEELEEARAIRGVLRKKLEADQDKKLRDAQISYARVYANTAEELFSTLYEMSGKKTRAYFYLAKAAALAEAGIKTAQAVAGALGSPPYGPGAIAMASIVGALGAVQVAKIAAQTMAGGGPVVGGSGTKDDVIIAAQGGEFFHPVEAVKFYGKEVMEGIRTRSIPKEIFSGVSLPKLQVEMPKTRFQEGGPVPPVTAPGEPIIPEVTPINVVNVTDPNEALRLLVSRPGEQAILNVIGRHGRTVRRLIQ